MNILAKIPRTWQRVGLFVVLTYVISTPFMFLAIINGSMNAAHGLYALGGMSSPSVAALITVLIFKKEVGSFGWHWGKWKYQIWSILIPFFYCLIGYSLVWLLGLGNLLPEKVVSRLVPLAISLTMGCIFALGEEIGWTGFLIPQVAKEYGFTTAAFTRGIVWSVWHYPMIIYGIYGNQSTPLWFNLFCFTIFLTGISFIFTWLRLKSGSLWTGMFIHASHNGFIQSFFTPITGTSLITGYFIGEFGVALTLISIVLAFLFWRKRTNLPTEVV
ncbi:MAG: CPBP family intramembrane metalloprotease [Bacteroidetes bacterium]|nr:CPBP family intramembrane metalloprotease [Bacteroidota bacterium]